MKKFTIFIIIIIFALAFWYFIWPVFRVVEVNDELPVSVQETSEIIENSNFTGSTNPQQASRPVQSPAVEERVEQVEERPEPTPEPARVSTPTPPPAPTPEPEPAPVPTPVRNEITGTFAHPASGFVRVINTGTQHVVRFEDFKTIDGPRVHVYLTKDLDADEFVDLGFRKGTEGNINYTVPDGVDINEYKYVVHWCVPFGVLFNYAELR